MPMRVMSTLTGVVARSLGKLFPAEIQLYLFKYELLIVILLLK